MPTIRPVSDLRNNFAEINKLAQSSNEPVFLTKNGVGTLVVMSMDAYEESAYGNYIYDKLHEAEVEAVTNPERISHDDVMEKARNVLNPSKE